MVLSMTTWFYGKFRKKTYFDFWIYKHSRHPQYLGFLIWSYGYLLFGWAHPPAYYIPTPSIFWLFSALLILGMAINEENTLKEHLGSEYEKKREKIPFFVPLPLQMRKLLKKSINFLIKKDWPDNEREILIILSFYGIVLIPLSFLTSLLTFIMAIYFMV